MTRVALGTINAQGVQVGPGRTWANVRDALPGVDLGFLQEVAPTRAKRWRLRRRLPNRLIGVRHATGSAAKAGVALVWSKATLVAKGKRRLVKASSAQPGIRDRYLLIQDFKVRGVKGSRFRAISGHRPLAKVAQARRDFDARLASEIRRSPYPVIVGLDANARAYNPAPQLVYWSGVGIDGFLVSRSLPGRVSSPSTLPATGSDHRPVGAVLAVMPGK